MPNHDRSHHHIIYGLAKLSDEISLDAVCPTGVHRIESEHTVVDPLLAIVTAGIYTPTTVQIWCERRFRHDHCTHEKPSRRFISSTAARSVAA